MSIGVAVIVGALLVGSSVRATLHQLAMQRVGGVEWVADYGARMFGADLASRFTALSGRHAASSLRQRAMVIGRDDAGLARQLNRVQLMGVDGGVAELTGAACLWMPLEAGEAAINTMLAHRLGVSVGDSLSIRMSPVSALPLEAPLSEGAVGAVRRRVVVAHVIADEALGRFSLEASQSAPATMFVAREWLAEALGVPGRANLLLVAASADGATPEAAMTQALERAWMLADAGLSLKAGSAGGVHRLTSRRLFLDPGLDALLETPGTGGTMAYLVETIRAGARTVPYSFALAGTPAGNGELTAVPADLDDDEVILSDWVAERLGVGPGQEVTLGYQVPMSGGNYARRERAFRVHSIVPVAQLAVERTRMPDFPGLTDVEACGDWDIGMPLEEELLADQDNEAYWDDYGATPKVLVTLRAGQAMWGNRFGDLMDVRFAAAVTNVVARVDPFVTPSGAGLHWRPLRAEALAAVDEALDFGQLFLGMSFFLMTAGLLITGLVFSIAVEGRRAELGVLLALGYRPRRVVGQLMGELAALAVPATVGGIGLGLAYAYALVGGVERAWLAAVAGTRLRVAIDGGAIAVGALVALSISLATGWCVARGLVRRSPVSLLQGQDPIVDCGTRSRPRTGRARRWASAVLGLLTLCSLVMAWRAGPSDMVMAFFGSAFLVLLVLTNGAYGVLRKHAGAGHQPSLSLGALAMRGATRRTWRSLGVVAALACGSFLVIAVGGMREDLRGQAGESWSGTGGFGFVAETTVGLTPQDVGELALRAMGGRAVGLRLRDGDDAGCLNLNRAREPRLLGVDPAAMRRRHAFCPAAEEGGCLWDLLDLDGRGDWVPALVGDHDTAAWGLEATLGLEEGQILTYRDERGETFRIKLVGSLPMRISVFQGSVLIPESAFVEHFPSETGHRVLLLDSASTNQHEMIAGLTRRFERQGLDVEPAVDRLMTFYQVEMTYLAMFLVLGGLGVLLGGAGVGLVLARTVLERSRQLATLRAVGFSRGRVMLLVVLEHVGLVVAGTTIGTLSAMVAILPSLRSTTTQLPFGDLLGWAAVLAVGGVLWVIVAAVACMRGELQPALQEE